MKAGQGDADHDDARAGLVDNRHLRRQGLDQRVVEVIGQRLQIARIDGRLLALLARLGRCDRDDDARNHHLVELLRIETVITPAFDAIDRRIRLQARIVGQETALGQARRIGCRDAGTAAQHGIVSLAA